MLVNQEALAALNLSFSAIFNKAFALTQTIWERIATPVPSTTGQNNYGWLGDFPGMREWVGERVVRGLAVHDYLIKNKKFEGTVGVKEDDLDDDNTGIYAPLFEGLGQAAKQHPDKLVFDLLKNGTTGLCWDGQYFFDTDHPQGNEAGDTYSNYTSGAGEPWYLLSTKGVIKPLLFQKRREARLVAQDDPKLHREALMRGIFVYGVDYRGNAGYALPQLAYRSEAALDETNYAAAKLAMSTRKNSEDEPLEIMVDLIVVSPANEWAAKKLFKSPTYSTGGDNPFYNDVDVLVAPRLAA